MPPSIFVSCTGTDLDRDLKPAVIEAIRGEQAEPVASQTWDTDMGFAVDVCRRMVEEQSDHYIGIFGYWRGWEPVELGGCSITEAEFDWAWALRDRHPLAVFLPLEGSRIDLELLQRVAQAAKPQTPAQAQAQKQFVARVSALGAINRFGSEGELAIKTARRVLAWQGGGLRAAARAGTPAAPRVPREVLRAAFKAQVQALNLAWGALQTAGAIAPLWLVVHGPAGLGHADCLTALAAALPTHFAGEPHRLCRLALDTTLRAGDAATLAAMLATELGATEPAATPTALGAQLRTWLAGQHLVLCIEDLHRFDGGLAGFARSIWAPLCAAAAGHPFGLVALTTIKPAMDGEAVTQPAPTTPGAAFDATRPALLPALRPLTAAELARLLLAQHGAAAQAKAEALITDTGGLYDLLATPPG